MTAVLETAVEASDLIGIAVVELRLLNDSVRGFYERFNFAPLTDNPAHLYLSLDTARETLA